MNSPAARPDPAFLYPAAKNGFGIYIHVPFCRQACVYCNFHFSTSQRHREDMVAAIITEIGLQRGYLDRAPVRTIYFGGGTPSLLRTDELKRIFDAITENFPITKLEECTLEANPDDLDRQYLRHLRGVPIDRLSIGVQSFRDEDLRYMKRAHDAARAEYAVKAAQDVGFDNLTLDLIYGVPGLDDAAWRRNIRFAVDLGVQHLSAYALTVEPHTELQHTIAAKKAAPVDASQSAGQFTILMEEAARAGLDHYEISNFARPGRHAIHNTSYWQSIPYLGIGPSAHSYDGVNRRWNVASNAQYLKSILQDHKTPAEVEVLTPEMRLNEYIMTSLRTMWGCSLAHISAQWGSNEAKQVERAAERYIEQSMISEKDGTLTLTSHGKLFADRIAGDLFV